MKGDAALRAEVDRAVLAELMKLGPEGFSKDALVKRFLERGTGRGTLYRWIDAILASGKPAKVLQKKADAAAKRRARKEPDPSTAVAIAAVAEIPMPLSGGDSITPDGMEAAIPFMRRLQECFRAADQLLKHGRTAEGDVRNARLILQASEHVRKALETAARIQDGLLQLTQVQRFHQAVFSVIKEADPAMAEKLLIRLRQVNATWGVE